MGRRNFDCCYRWLLSRNVVDHLFPHFRTHRQNVARVNSCQYKSKGDLASTITLKNQLVQLVPGASANTGSTQTARKTSQLKPTLHPRDEDSSNRTKQTHLCRPSTQTDPPSPHAGPPAQYGKNRGQEEGNNACYQSANTTSPTSPSK